MNHDNTLRTIGRRIAAVALVAFPLFAQAAPITSLFNTGVNAAKATVANNSTELHYTLTAVPAGGSTGVRTATSANGYPIGPWIGDDSLSTWIGPNSDSQLNGPAGNYTYRTTFTLAGLNFLTASITGLWATDDVGVNILLNGVATGLTTSGGFTSFTPFTISTGFVAGVNTLDFIVLNGGGPTGLRVEMTGTAAAVPEPDSLALLSLGLVGLGLTLRARRRARGA